MPLKIRCPHCHRTLFAEDDTVGQPKLCPACGKAFTVPIPVHEGPPPVEVGGKCPKCGATIAPGTTYCPQCYWDVTADKRLPLGRRLQFVSVRTWTLLGLGTIAIAILALVGAHVYRSRARQHQQVAGTPMAARTPEHPGAEWVKRLLEAPSAAERSEAFNELLRIGPDGLPTLARALEGMSVDAEGELARNRRTAVKLLARGGDTRWLPLLGKLQNENALRETVLRARAMLGDGEVADALIGLWLAGLRRQMFFTRITELTPSSTSAANEAIVRRTQEETEGCAEALRVLGESSAATIIDRTLPTYWDSWAWLGQQRGEVFATELFELAKPPKQHNLEFKLRVRAARTTLDQAAQRASPAARAASGIVLAHCAPQYRSARQRIIATLVTVLAECEPRAQQQITWALARLTSRPFGGLTEKRNPSDFGRQAVQDVLGWARSGRIGDPGTLQSASTAYPTPPKLIRRVVTPGRQLEHDLLREFASGWDALDEALDRWLAADLGCTPRVARLLDPGQRNPNHPALAAAMIVAAEYQAHHLRPQLALWWEAVDQPAWVRGFAYTTLGALDAHQARADTTWPSELTAELLGEPETQRPGWELWGRLLAAGGPRLPTQLRDGARSLSPAMRARLMQAAEEAARRRPRGP
jgi:hypothetical protein